MAELAKTVLDDIIALRRRRIREAQERVPLGRLEQTATNRSERRDFARAISDKRLRVIAELKRASPSRGVLCGEYTPRELARSYESAGAAALSVLTEQDFFGGSLDDLQAARGAVRLPVLRKDFVLDPYQVYESVAVGTDALLLIVAALADENLRGLLALCDRLGIAALVEVHTEAEVDRALATGAQIIGVNNRDLRTLEVNLETSFRLRSKIPSRCRAVSESGIRTPEDLRRLADAEFDAVLIGERFMKEADPGKALADLLRGFSESASPATEQ
jgi:indole-3-glycerol phosphate synthase